VMCVVSPKRLSCSVDHSAPPRNKTVVVVRTVVVASVVGVVAGGVVAVVVTAAVVATATPLAHPAPRLGGKRLWSFDEAVGSDWLHCFISLCLSLTDTIRTSP
jgi:hypothetical protein